MPGGIWREIGVVREVKRRERGRRGNVKRCRKGMAKKKNEGEQGM